MNEIYKRAFFHAVAITTEVRGLYKAAGSPVSDADADRVLGPAFATALEDVGVNALLSAMSAILVACADEGRVQEAALILARDADAS